MPILPLIDALIFLGWSSLMGGFLLKAVYITTTYRPHPVGLSPIDFLWIAMVCLLFALTLAARTWVKAHEPALMARRRTPAPYYPETDTGEFEAPQARELQGPGSAAPQREGVPGY